MAPTSRRLDASSVQDFIIDLHNTTAATGVALLMAPNDEFLGETMGDGRGDWGTDGLPSMW